MAEDNFDTQEAIIIASEYWNHTKIQLRADCSYSFEVVESFGLMDSSIDVKEKELEKNTGIGSGFESTNFFLKSFEWTRRVPNENWFKLIGCIDKKNYFVIGNKLESYTPHIDGELICFVNDFTGFYCNNHGYLKLRIETHYK
jgi:hypothetical protein